MENVKIYSGIIILSKKTPASPSTSPAYTHTHCANTSGINFGTSTEVVQCHLVVVGDVLVVATGIGVKLRPAPGFVLGLEQLTQAIFSCFQV